MANISHFTQTVNGVSTTYDIHDANAVDLTNNQTVAGNKEFIGTTTAHDLVPSATGTYDFGSSSYQWNNAYATTFNGNVVGRGDLTLQSNSGMARIFLRNNDASNFPNSVNLYSKVNDVEYGVFLNGGSFFPTINGEMNFGYTQRRWKSVHTNAINGINPGALSLPSGTVGMNLIGDVSVVGAEKKLSKDITVTGYIYIDVSFTSSNRLNLYNDTKKYGIWIPCDSGRIRQIMPISADDRLEFNVLDAGSTVNAIQLFSCQGNV